VFEAMVHKTGTFWFFPASGWNQTVPIQVYQYLNN
jgi:hypothetical protein